jgi:predicted outer membrane lipoprotein
MDFWYDLLSNTIATFIGAGLGVLGALWLSHSHERKTEKVRKKKILLVLKVELMENLSPLKDWVDSGKKKVEVICLTGLLKDVSWEVFSNGGELEWIKDPSLLSELSDAFSVIRSIRNLANRYFDMIEFPTNETSSIATNNVWKMLDGAVTYAEHQIPKTLEAIEKNL